MKFEFNHCELALLASCVARSQAELGLLSDQFLTEFKADLEKLLMKLEGTQIPGE